MLENILKKKFVLHKVNVKCSKCEAQIDELPFEPAPDRPVYCRECNNKRKNIKI